MDFYQAKQELNRLGLSIRYTETGEYRVNFKSGKEATAYYTDDLADAVQTGHAMALYKQREASNG